MQSKPPIVQKILTVGRRGNMVLEPSSPAGRSILAIAANWRMIGRQGTVYDSEVLVFAKL